MKRSTIRRMARQLLKENDLKGWRFELKSKMGHNLGGCNYRARTIVMSDYYVDFNAEELVIDTLIHEVAHALTPGHNHDDVWKAMAEKLGCKPERSWKNEAVIKPGKYQAICPHCQMKFHKYRKPKYTQGYYCPQCGKEKGPLTFLLRATT